MQSPEDSVEVVSACFEHKVGAVLLYAENLTGGFFDLSSGEAGIILQKLRNYHVKLAVVAPIGKVRQSTMFVQMAKEESRVGDFRICEDRATAEAWLLA